MPRCPVKDRILTDKGLQLGDEAGIIKAFYALDSRYGVAHAAQGTILACGTGGTEADEHLDPSSDKYIEACERDQQELTRSLGPNLDCIVLLLLLLSYPIHLAFPSTNQSLEFG